MSERTPNQATFLAHGASSHLLTGASTLQPHQIPPNTYSVFRVRICDFGWCVILVFSAGGELLLGDGSLPFALPGPGEGAPVHRLCAAGVQRAGAVATGA